LEQIPTVLIAGTEQNPFRARYRIMHQARLESKFMHGAIPAAFISLEPRIDKYNHLAADA
jgi:hypothetical protein